MRHLKILFLTSLILLSACGGGSGSGAADANKKTVTINGSEPKAYYLSFGGTPTGDCQKDGSLHQAYASGNFTAGKTQDGKPLKGFVKLYLQDNMTFILQYEEFELKSEYEGSLIDSDEVAGTWTVDENNNLELKYVGLGGALKYNGRDTIDFTFGEIFRKSIANKNVILERFYNQIGCRN